MAKNTPASAGFKPIEVPAHDETALPGFKPRQVVTVTEPAIPAVHPRPVPANQSDSGKSGKKEA